MAKIISRLCLPVGGYRKDGAERDTIEYRDIGVIMEFEAKSGNKWQEVMLNADVLNPVLFQLAKSQMEKGSSRCRVKMFDAAPRQKPDPGKDEPPPSSDDLGDEPPPF